MLFNSFEYLIFFPTVVLLFFVLPPKTRWFLLLLASYFFYASWNVGYLALIASSTLISFIAGRQIYKARRKRQKLTFLWISILANMGPLLVYKYFDFFNDSLAELADLIGWNYGVESLGLLLPVGISFFTFQTMSYTLDIYFGKIKPERHAGVFALYVSFFPQLVAGPIERSGNLIPQLKATAKSRFSFENMREGLTMIGWGLFKKVVVADRLAVVVNDIYNNAGEHHGLTLIVATILFAFQIYGDFSGYSDIAIGSAKVLGIDLMRNFDRPYFSKSVSEFWRRWHISLSSWFRDYVYIPLGGNRVVKWRWYYNLFVTFLLSGLWHGAAWTFVAWGALHGLYLVVGVISRSPRDKLLKKINVKKTGWLYKLSSALIVFGLVNLSWILFRANSFSDAAHIFGNLGTGISEQLRNIGSLDDFAELLGTTGVELGIILATVSAMMLAHFFSRGSANPISKIAKLPIYFRWPIYYALILAIVFLGVFGESEFIYFQF